MPGAGAKCSGFLCKAIEIGAPTAEPADIYGLFEAAGFTDKTTNPTPVVQLKLAQSQRCGNKLQKTSYLAGWHRPDLNLDSCTL